MDGNYLIRIKRTLINKGIFSNYSLPLIITNMICNMLVTDAENELKPDEYGQKFQVARRAPYHETWLSRRGFNPCRAIGQMLISNTGIAGTLTFGPANSR